MRWKLIIGNAIVVVLVGVVAWLLVRGSTAEALSKPVDSSVSHGIESFRGMRAIDREALSNVARRVTRRDDLRKVFEATTEQDQRTRAEDFAAAFVKDPAAVGLLDQMPDFVVVVNAQGVVLGRNGDSALDRSRNLKSEFAVVDAAITQGEDAMVDFVKYDKQKWFTAIVAPVRLNNSLAGVVLLAYSLADTAAKRDQSRVGLQVGYLMREGAGFALASTSLDDNGKKQELVRWANDASHKLAASFDAGGSVAVQDITMGGETWRIAAAPMPIAGNAQPGTRGGFVVMENLSATREPSGGIALPVLILAIVGGLAVFGVNFVISGDVLKTVERIEEGLLRIINGDRSHRMEIRHAELGGVVDRVNQLVSLLSGEDEGEQTDEQGRISKPLSRGGAPNAINPRKNES